MNTQWRSFGKTIKQYWKSYGGLKAMFGSPYLHVSLFILLCTFGFWSDDKWWNQSLSILPNLLGFTLGGFAIFLSLGSDEFRSLLASNDEVEESFDKSSYMIVVSAFIHFVVIQIFALIISIIANASQHTTKPDCISNNINNLLSVILGAFGYGFFLYSLVLSLSVCFAIYRLASLFSKIENDKIWFLNEDEELEKLFKSGLTIQEIGKNNRHTEKSIEIRLRELKLLE